MRGITYHKISLYVFKLLLKSSFLRLFSSAFNMRLIDANPGDMNIHEANKIARWGTDATTNIKPAHARLQRHHEREEMLMLLHSRVDAFVGIRKGTEMEARVPPKFDVICCQIIVAILYHKWLMVVCSVW